MGTGNVGASALSDSLGDFLDLGTGDQEGDVEHVVTEGLNQLARSSVGCGLNTYRVGGDVNVLLLAVLNQIVALENGVALDLVGGGNDTGGLDKSLELVIVSMSAKSLRR